MLMASLGGWGELGPSRASQTTRRGLQLPACPVTQPNLPVLGSSCVSPRPPVLGAAGCCLRLPLGSLPLPAPSILHRTPGTGREGSAQADGLPTCPSFALG